MRLVNRTKVSPYGNFSSPITFKDRTRALLIFLVFIFFLLQTFFLFMVASLLSLVYKKSLDWWPLKGPFG